MGMIFDSGSGLEKVVSVEHIRQLAHDRRSCCIFYRILPASFLLNMPASLLLRAIDSGRIHIYPKSETRPKKPLRLKKEGARRRSLTGASSGRLSTGNGRSRIM